MYASPGASGASTRGAPPLIGTMRQLARAARRADGAGDLGAVGRDVGLVRAVAARQRPDLDRVREVDAE